MSYSNTKMNSLCNVYVFFRDIDGAFLKCELKSQCVGFVPSDGCWTCYKCVLTNNKITFQSYRSGHKITIKSMTLSLIKSMRKTYAMAM